MSSHDGVPMIVTLTPNPSNDRTVTLAGPLERGAVQRLLSVTMQAGGKGVNISRAAMSAGLGTEAVFPARPDDPFVTELLAAGIACYPAPPAGDVRINLAITEPDGTTTKLNSPGAIVSASHLDDLAATAALPGRLRHLGRARRLAATGCSRRLVRRARARRCAARRPGWPSTPARARSRPWSRHSPDAAPDLMKPNGEELASFVGGDEETFEADPATAATAARQLVDQGRRRGPGDPRRRRRLPGDRRRRLARHPSPDHRGQHRRGRRLEPVRLPVGRRTRRFADRAARPRGRLRERRGLPTRDDDPRSRSRRIPSRH